MADAAKKDQPADFKPTIPKAVQNQVKAAEALHQRAYAGKTPGQRGEGLPHPTNATASVSELPPAKPKTDEPNQPPSDAEASRPASSTAPPVADPTPTPDNRTREIEAENLRMKRELDSMKVQVQTLQRTLASLHELPKQADDPAPAPRQKRLSPDDVDAYGEGLTKFVQNAAADLLDEQLGPMQTELARVKQENDKLRAQLGQVETVTQQSVAQRVESYLDAEVPTWRQLSRSVDFADWLEQTLEPYSGQKFSDLLQRADQMADEQRIARIFQAYTQSQASPAPAAPQQPVAQASSGVDPMSLVAPGRPVTSHVDVGAASDQQSPPVTQKFITQFYTDVTRGDYDKRPQERARIEAMIARALQQKRIR